MLRAASQLQYTNTKRKFCWYKQTGLIRADHVPSTSAVIWRLWPAIVTNEGVDDVFQLVGKNHRPGPCLLGLDCSIVCQINCTMHHLLCLALAVPVLCGHLLADLRRISGL